MGFLDKLNDFFGNRPRKYSEDGYYKYALKQEELGNIDEAIECYEIILSHDKQHYDSYARLFELYPKRQKWVQMKKMGQQFNENLWHLKSSLGHHAIQDAQSALSKEAAKAAAMKPQSNATKVSENSHPTPKATAKVDVPPTQKQVANNKSKISLPKKEDYLPDERNYSSFGVRYADFCDDLPKFDFYKSDNFEISESATERIHSFL